MSLSGIGNGGRAGDGGGVGTDTLAYFFFLFGYTAQHEEFP